MNAIRSKGRAIRDFICKCHVILILGSFVCLTSASTFAQGRYDSIVIGGQPAPDGNGTYWTLTSSVLNGAGEVAFHASLLGTLGGTSDDTGVFMASGGAVTQIAREGQLSPDGNGVFALFNAPAFNAAGFTAFHSNLTGTQQGSGDNEGIFLGNGTSLTQIAREGQLAPDFNGNLANLFSTTLNNSGRVAFFSYLTNTSESYGIFSGSGGALSQVARPNQAVPNGNGFFSFLDSNISQNDAGAVAFGSDLVGTTGGSADNAGLYRWRAGLLTEIARKGQLAPDGNGMVADLSAPVLNDSGTLAFHAEMSNTAGGLVDDRFGIFKSSGGALTQIARGGQAAPDGNGILTYFDSRVSINDAEETSFYAQLALTAEGSSDNTGIFLGNGGAITQIARAGQLAPDGNGRLSSLGQHSLNNSGVVAFQSSMSETAGSGTDDEAIFLGDGEQLIQIARKGQLLGGLPITALAASFGQTADRSALNDHGQVVYEATVSNGRVYIRRFTPDLHYRRTYGSNWDYSPNWTLGLTPGDQHDVYIDPAASLRVDGPLNDTGVRSVQIGGGTGIATLALQRGAVLTATNGVTIQPTGVLTGDGVIAGNVNNYGTVLADNVSVQSILTNYGVVRGSGRLNASVINDISGEFRAGPSERMVVTSPFFENQGTIEIVGGEVELLTFEATSTGEVNIIDGTFRTMSSFFNGSDTGLVSGSDAIMHFGDSLVNFGGLGFTAGQSHVFGDVYNYDPGTINVSSGQVTFYDDLEQNGEMIVAKVGQTNSVAVLFGAFSGAGGFYGGGDVFAFGDLRPGNSPASVQMDGNLFLGGSSDVYIEITGQGLGQFDQLVVTGDFSVSGDLIVDLLDGFQLTFNDEFLIADVGGTLSGQFFGLDEGDLVGTYDGMDLFISYAAGNGNDIALFTAVPEPRAFTCYSIALALILALYTRNRRSFGRAVA